MLEEFSHKEFSWLKARVAHWSQKLQRAMVRRKCQGHLYNKEWPRALDSKNCQGQGSQGIAKGKGQIEMIRLVS